jgi:hypothetical protein
MAVVAYLLVLVGGGLSDDEYEAFRQTEKLNELVGHAGVRKPGRGNFNSRHWTTRRKRRTTFARRESSSTTSKLQPSMMPPEGSFRHE